MNEAVCRLCRRYERGGRPDGFAEGWGCARSVYKRYSDVVPGYSRWMRDEVVPVTEAMSEPPEWCERPLEHLLTEPGDEMPDSAVSDGSITYDGNDAGERIWKARTGGHEVSRW